MTRATETTCPASAAVTAAANSSTPGDAPSVASPTTRNVTIQVRDHPLCLSPVYVSACFLFIYFFGCGGWMWLVVGGWWLTFLQVTRKED